MKKLLIVALLLLSACSYSNLDDVKAQAADRWKSAGYEVVGYEGYKLGIWLGGRYGGANVWYILSRPSSKGITYTGYIQKWGSEYHIYSVKAIDAIKP